MTSVYCDNSKSATMTQSKVKQFPPSYQNGYMNVFQLPPVTMATGPPHYKIILCGEYGVGKSSIFRRFRDDSIEENMDDRMSTVGLDQCSRLFPMSGIDIKLTLWDTGGMERMSFIGSSYYRGADAALLCYSCEKRETFTILSQYILDVVMNAEGAKIFLCGNMCGDESESAVTEADVENFKEECDGVLSGVYKVSSHDNKSILDMFEDIARVMHDLQVDRISSGGFMLVPATDELAYNKKKKCLLL
ncbi:ras-related protein Rab-1D isoform X2 [Octopus sinensis]|uniref:Ras-related protein Rab-1D isoform X2 n=1 Tax=Octopus sinensis TaxID=2607531 RepID=A0A6P7S4P1_9MOLL|nr:ras-related protein Rab-1D isoform X2 [Octopus sinensis]